MISPHLRPWPAALIAALLLGCASPRHDPTHIDEFITKELDTSVAPKKPVPADIARVQESLLPPLSSSPPPSVAKALEPRFDLSVNNAPAQQVFLSVVSGTRYSVLVHPEVAGSLTVNLKDVTVIEALDSIRELYGYEYRLDGTRIMVLPVTIQTRVFRVNYLIGQRLGRSDLRVSSGSVADSPSTGGSGPAPAAGAPGGGGAASVSDSSRIQTSTRSDFWTELSQTLQEIVGNERGRSVVVNPQAGLVVVRALPSELRQVEIYLNAIRASVQRQVMLEAKIIEVTLNEQFQTGINWALFSTSERLGRGAIGMINPGNALPTIGTITGAGITVNPTPSAAQLAAVGTGSLIAGVPGGALLGLAFQTQNFSSLLQFLESQGSVQVLSSPRIATMNNQKAVLKVGNDEFFVTGISGATATTTSTTGTAAPTFPNLTLRPFFSGVALDITPQIDEDASIILHDQTSVSRVQQDNRSINLGTTFGGQVSLPLARSSVSETDSIVKVNDSQIVAIGGLMKVDLGDDRSGLPGAQDTQVGGLFSSRQRTIVKKELVILIKPTVIQSEQDWAEDLRQSRERIRRLGAPVSGSARN